MVNLLSYLIMVMLNFALIHQSDEYSMKRKFVPMSGSFSLQNLDVYPHRKDAIIRILQFNILADGLAGFREGGGCFSRASKEHLNWDYRKDRIINEILQYNPDIVTLQEVDHYMDSLLPSLFKAGYVGVFAPKPTSACLEVGGKADGCAMFLKRTKLRIISTDTKTLTLSRSELADTGELNEDDRNIRAQNQVAIMAVCELLGDDSQLIMKYNYDEGTFQSAPPIIIATTHLLSSKSAVGERYRERGINEVLFRIRSVYNSYASRGRTPAVLLSGGFNAVVDKTNYEPLCYRAVKRNYFDLRSVYQDDVAHSPVRLSSKDLYTTWKARRRDDNGQEVIVKRCIDYIFYLPFRPNIVKDKGMTTTTAAIVVNPTQLDTFYLLRFFVYFVVLAASLSSFLSTRIIPIEWIALKSVSWISLLLFELLAKGSLFRPLLAAWYNNNRVAVTASTQQVPTTMTLRKTSNSTVSSAMESHASNFKSTTKKPKKSERKYFSNVANLSQSVTPVQPYGRPGFQAVSALDLFPEELIELDLPPNAQYPSDHVAIAADLELMW
ncbi:hypothetical protein EON65_47535 [archaeon]|nr:MAG: hypothetical protein EON65_47535 [archaeon]